MQQFFFTPQPEYSPAWLGTKQAGVVYKGGSTRSLHFPFPCIPQLCLQGHSYNREPYLNYTDLSSSHRHPALQSPSGRFSEFQLNYSEDTDDSLPADYLRVLFSSTIFILLFFLFLFLLLFFLDKNKELTNPTGLASPLLFCIPDATFRLLGRAASEPTNSELSSGGCLQRAADVSAALTTATGHVEYKPSDRLFAPQVVVAPGSSTTLPSDDCKRYPTKYISGSVHDAVVPRFNWRISRL
jgi:hypothetical protein